jgi:broad specificity phosphatase PhoE
VESWAEVISSATPSKLLFLLIRHGEAEHNLPAAKMHHSLWLMSNEGVDCTIFDPNLTEKGVQQASHLGINFPPEVRQIFENREALFVVSPLRRAVKTALTIAPNIEWIVDEECREQVKRSASDLRCGVTCDISLYVLFN